MAKKALPIFIRDHQTGSLGEYALDESKLPALAGGVKGTAPLRVLVADDNEADRLLTIRQISKAWPAEREIIVECAADGMEALEKIRAGRFGLVILDHDMPHQNGPEVLRTVRAEGRRVPVVLVSSQNREAIATDLTAMAASFVSKETLNPVDFSSAIVESIYLQTRVPRTPGG